MVRWAPRSACLLNQQPLPPTGSSRRLAAVCSQQVWWSSDAWPLARLSTTRPWPHTSTYHYESLHSGAVRAKWSRAIGVACVRSRVPHDPEPTATRSPYVPRKIDSDLSMALTRWAAYRQLRETISVPRVATRCTPMPRRHSPSLGQCISKTLASSPAD